MIVKDQEAILSKLGIENLNQMQIDAHKTISSKPEVILLSPTGSGKTLAFLLPLLHYVQADKECVQILILVPSRELAIQIEQVIRSMGSGIKANAVYGGRAGSKDKIDLKHPPSILIGTPGRVSDHIRNKVVSTKNIRTLILDEFDKSLEVGFEKEMKEIVSSIPSLTRRILTSATQKVEIPEFVGLKNPARLNYLDQKTNKLKLKTVESSTRDKLKELISLLNYTGQGSGIVFCNLKDSIKTVSSYLSDNKISHGCFYGGLDQLDRERALIKFRNGTHRILLATDLAARGIDVPEMDFIIHYELPIKKDEFIHRNGRTARMNNNGVAYLLKGNNERLPEFVRNSSTLSISNTKQFYTSSWETLYITGGRKDKISKGDIAGLFFKQGNLNKDELGTIELKQDCAYVAISKSKANKIANQLNNSRLKKKKVRISLLD